MIVFKLFYHIQANIFKFILKIIYGKKIIFHKKITWRKGFVVMIGKSGKVQIGDGCYFNNNCSLDCTKYIEIGENSIFGENVKIYDHNHCFRSSTIPIKKQGYSNGMVIIGKNCWIGSNVVILKNSKIGDHCVIGAGCCISGEVPSHTIVKQDSGNLLYKKMIV